MVISRRTLIPDGRARLPSLLVAASAIWGTVLLALAATVPIASLPDPPAITAQTPANPSSAPVSTGGPAILHAVPRVTLVAYAGPRMLLLVMAPLLVSLTVGALLRARVRRGFAACGTTAWILSVVLLAATVVGFVTFLIGITVVPNGILLVIACARSRPSQGHRDSDPEHSCGAFWGHERLTRRWVSR